ncbi:HtaA domain-containing protein [Amycolatopsis suaedae]|uniref:Htaa domain-containing protein n=1 Tax=Amycolatopsis suaedae TaxID=2510978 RepID=A0A4Q7J1U6_9PSEU|nr:HtaA domain-containing protein [Amycolatopsis suaedae]RZQ59904.1 hypothetical protein EWH70_31225 [Amycolatopsis suaedae]
MSRRVLAVLAAVLVAAPVVPATASAQQWTPAVTVTPSAELDPDGGTTVTIRGTGFDPAGNDGKGYGLRIGPDLPTLRDPGTTTGHQLTRLIKADPVGLQVKLNADGTWQTTAKIKARYDGTDGVRHDAGAKPFAVYTFGWRSTATTWDTVNPLAFKGIVVQPPPSTSDPGLRWGFRKAWRDYVTRFGGSTTLSGGVVEDPDPRWVKPKPFQWPVASASFDGTKGRVTFTGTARFAVPSHYIWDYGVADPEVTFAGDGTGTLRATVNYAFYGTAEKPEKVQPPTRVTLADLKFAGAPVQDGKNVRATIASAVLTKEGADSFAGFYEPGTELDAGAVLFEGTADPGQPGGEPALVLPPAPVTPGGKLAVAGAGFVPGEQVTLDSEAGQSRATAGAAGAFLAEVPIPAGLRAGEHTLVAVGAVSAKPVRATFTVAAGQPGAPDCALQPGGAVKGELLWGLKKSFRQYVGGKPGNSITAGGGAEVAGEAYRFPFGSADYRAPGELTANFGGSVTFAYPAHFFTLVLANPRVKVTGTAGALFADMELRVTDPKAPAKPVKQTGVALATLDLGAATRADKPGVVAFTGIAASLTSPEAFGGFYTAGTPLDPVSVALGAECSTLPGLGGAAGSGPGGTGGAGQNLVPPVKFRPSGGLAATGLPWFLVPAGLTLLLAGTALVLATRRRPVT